MPTPDRPTRAAVALGVGLLACALAYWSSTHLRPGEANDFDHLWYAARGLVAGTDPYVAAVNWGWLHPLYYPLPTVLFVLPLAGLALPWAMALFAGTGAALFTYTQTRRGWWTLWFLLSPAFANCLVVGQWSVWLVALAGVPLLQGLYCLKPSDGAILWLLRPSWRVALVGAALTLASIAVWPAWPLTWLHNAAGSQAHRSLVLVPGGALLLLALLKWRRPEARLLAGLALVPHSVLLYAMLLLVPTIRTRREAQLFALLTAAAEIGVHWRTHALATAAGTPLPFFDAVRPIYLWTVYVPCLIMVLRRPNVAPAADADLATPASPRALAA